MRCRRSRRVRSGGTAAATRGALRHEPLSRLHQLAGIDRWGETAQRGGKLERINNFVNQHIAFDSDTNVWQASDYWATPLETLGQGRGDCEDLAILKYISLRLGGVPRNKLRLVYVKARLDILNGPAQQAHMVLAYYARPDSEPLILDNLDTAIKRAALRTDLTPIFSFNSEGIFGDLSGANKVAARIGRLSRWEDTWRRIVAEGYE